jgi:hypothetical protein
MGGLRMAIKYLRHYENGTVERVDNKPAYSLYTATKPNDDRDVFIGGKWYPASNGDAVLNDTFDTDLDGWTVVSGIVWDSGTAKGTVAGQKAYKQITGLSPTERYIISARLTTTGNNYCILDVGTTNGAMDIARLAILGTTTSGTYSTFISGHSTIWLEMELSTVASGACYYDDIVIYKVEPTLGTPYTEQFTYLSQDGKLLGVEVANGNVVDIHLDDNESNEVAPFISVPAIQADNLIANENIETKGEFIGKNACTAWVNFDCTTTPPTIRDSFNISDVIRTSVGHYDIEFITTMDNTDYSMSNSNRGNLDPIRGPSGVAPNVFLVDKAQIVTLIGATATSNGIAGDHSSIVCLNFFGGKN